VGRVLLINVNYWRENDIAGQLIEMTDNLHDKVTQDDQSILNMLFENRWLELPFAYKPRSLTAPSGWEPKSTAKISDKSRVTTISQSK